ncbi:MAG: serine protease [Pontiellaceae bacterium]
MDFRYLVLLICVVSLRSALAITVADLAVAESNPSNVAAYADFNWDFIYNYKGSSAVAVDDHWLITAAHVADDGGSGGLTINGEVFTQVQQLYHPTADLALVRFDKELPGFYPLYSGRVNRIGTNPELLMVGWGYTGAVFSASFQNGPSGRYVKRWGTNRAVITGQPVTADMGGSAGSRTSDIFSTLFNISDTLYEAGAVQYDSGGGVFIKQNNQWKLAGGIILLLPPADPNEPDNYPGNLMIEIRKYLSWINDVLDGVDSDGDGLPNHFEDSYGAGTNMDAGADTDGDGQSNLQEWFADTIPTDGNSVFELLGSSTPSSLHFSSSASREYQVQFRTNLMTGSWIETNAWSYGESGSSIRTAATNNLIQFNRIGVRIP